MNYNIPRNWSWVKLGDVAEFKNGINFSKDQKGEKGILTIDVYNMYSKGIFVDLENVYRVDKKINDDYVLKYGDLLFVRSSVKREGVGFTTAFRDSKEDVTYCGFIIRARANTEKILPEFATYYFRTSNQRNEIVSKAKQVTITNISQDRLKELDIPLPPLPEQKKIVEKIEELFSGLDDGVTSLKKAKAQIRLYRQSVLASAFSGKLAKDKKRETKKELEAQLNGVQLARKAAEPKVDYTNQLPDGWKWVKLGEIIKVSSGKGLTSANMFTDGLYPVYGGNGVSGYYNDFLFEEPRLIIGRVGAKCGVIHITKPKSWVTDNALIVDFTSNNVEMKFLYHCLDYHNLNKLSVSTAQPVISGAKIYPYEIMLPPLKQQTKIVEEIEKRFSEADNLEKAIDESLAKSETLRQSILKQAFEGKLLKSYL